MFVTNKKFYHNNWNKSNTKYNQHYLYAKLKCIVKYLTDSLIIIS